MTDNEEDVDIFVNTSENKKEENIKLMTPETKQRKTKKKKEVVLVPMIEKPKQKRNRTEEAKQEMMERLAKARVKAFEKRLENKKLREQQKQEEAEKVEKVNKFLKNDDLFEKKYNDKFEKLTDMISNVSNDVNEIKEYKKQKELKRKKEVEDRLAKEEEHKIQKEAVVEETKPLTANQIVASINVPIKPSLPNYRKMIFGNKQKYF
jgi:hypothetical protein